MIENTLGSFGIKMNSEYIDLLMIEYDPKGIGKDLDFEKLNNDFMEFEAGNSVNSF